MPDQKELNQLSARIEELVGRVENIADPAVRANVITLLQALLDLHGQGLSRMLHIISEKGEVGRQIAERLSQDDLVAGLLLLYDIHPDGLRARVQKAVTNMQPEIHTAGASVEFLGMEDGEVRVRVTGGTGTCGSGNIDKTIRDFIYATAPDVTHIQIERVENPQVSGSLVQLQVNVGARAT
jgi:Fe-S cluster biogenesis protein NfuA